jgi:PAS domain S-box-containing protein
MPTAGLLAQLLEAVPDAMVLVDRDGRIVSVNGQASRLFGFSRADLVGQRVEMLIPERHSNGHVVHRTRYGERPIIRPMHSGLELAGLRKDGSEFPADISLRTLEVDGRTVIMAAIRDITERKKTEAERAKFIHEQTARVEAEAANLAKDEFLALLSHELRTPLQPMLGWARLLKSGRLERAAAQHAIDVIIQNVQHLTGLVTDLLDVSRILTGNLEIEMSRLDLPLVIETALESVRPVARANGITLFSSLDPEAGPVLGDADRLKYVVSSLVSNALKFTGEGGRVDVKLERDGNRARIIVRDTGRGIPPGILPHIFERFRQADVGSIRTRGGLGLGLTISRHLAELHGGTIAAESPGEGQGATFIVELPVTTIASAPVGPPAPDEAGAGPQTDGVEGARDPDLSRETFE